MIRLFCAVVAAGAVLSGCGGQYAERPHLCLQTPENWRGGIVQDHRGNHASRRDHHQKKKGPLRDHWKACHPAAKPPH